jgi:hypothetical protein
MSDIVERLKAIGGPAPDRASVVSSLRLEAAAEIERLQAALRWIAEHSNDPGVVRRTRQELSE